MPEKEVWFTPNLGSTDLVALFERPAEWSKARGQIHVFKFYSQQVVAETPAECPECGNNILPNLVRAGAFSRLRQDAIAVAIEAGAIKEWGCRATVTARVARTALANVAANGGTVRDLAMDEPLLGGESCGYTLAESASVTADFVRQAGAGARVGDIEPYPRFDAPTLQTWLRALMERGVKPAFFHLDVDRERATRIGADVERDLKTLRDFSESAKIPFGVIFWSDQVGSNRAYYEDTMAWVVRVGGTIGMPEHSLFQSWVEAPDGTRRMPVNLPEGDPGAYAHTRLVNDGLKVLRAYATIR